jgi:hypothetical protein
MPAGDPLFLGHNTYDAARSRLEMEFTLIQGDRTEKKSALQQVYTCRGFCRLLAEAGFAELATFGSTSQEPFRLGSHRLYAAARRV